MSVFFIFKGYSSLKKNGAGMPAPFRINYQVNITYLIIRTRSR